MDETRQMEVIDAEYRHTSLAYAPQNVYDYDNTALTNFGSPGKDGWYIYNRTGYSQTSAIPTNIEAFQNSGICSQWKNLSTDKTAAENTAAWMADSHFNKSGYAPHWTTHLTIDGGGWVIPNLFELIVIYCCSDKLDELDPTFNSNKDKGLGYTATNGRFYMSSGYVWSSTEYASWGVRTVYYDGYCFYYGKPNSLGVVPVREITL